MTVEELIEELQCQDPELEVRIAQQPSWPFEYQLNGVQESGGKLWLVEGDQLGYLDGQVASDLGWK
jgi:hypothetical protein